MSDQHLKPGESYLQYKRRVLDTKSYSFCGAKWYYATIWLNSGMTTSCHHPLPHHVSVEEVIKNPKALSNTVRKKQERREMQNGVRCNGCDYCWRVEDLESDEVSDRVYKSVLYTDEDLDLAYKTDPDANFDLKYLELSFDRTCNLSCSYCNPAFSTSWARDIRTEGPYINLTPDGLNHYGHSHENSGKYDDTDNPYVTAFFRWWESDLCRTLTHLRLTGGEPLMSPHTWKIIDWLQTTGARNDLYFAVNSNLMAKQDILDKLITQTGKFENFHIYTSGENTGSRGEYLRDGLDWETWTNNVHQLLGESSAKTVHSMCTINAPSVVRLVDYLDWCVGIKEKFGADRFYFTLNILRFPDFQNVLVLPQDIRDIVITDLQKWLGQNKPNINDMEVEHVQRLIGYLKKQNQMSSDRYQMERGFKSFYQQYDQRRGKNFIETFPELKEWYESISL